MISQSLVTNWTIKCRKLITRVGGLGLLCAGAFLTITNPGQGAYEAYATEALTAYLKNDVCSTISLYTYYVRIYIFRLCLRMYI